MNLLFHRLNVTALDIALEIVYCKFTRIINNDLMLCESINISQFLSRFKSLTYLIAVIKSSTKSSSPFPR